MLFVHYINTSKKDSIKYLFKSWQKTCGDCEPLQRAKILFHLKHQNFNESILEDNITCNILVYLNRKKKNYLFNEPYFSYVPIGKEFDNCTDSIAKTLIPSFKKKSVEYLLCELYSNTSDSILIKIRNPLYKTSKIRNNPCNATTKKPMEINKQGLQAALISGIWIPTNDQKILGIHPELGFQAGTKTPEWSIQFSLILKFMKTPTPYYAKRVTTSDSLELTQAFAGAYIGVDLGRTLFTSKHSELMLLSGLGFDAFTALKPNESIEGSGNEDVRSYNLNAGVGYRYYFKNGTHLGVEAKYNIVDYAHTGVTTLKGDFISVRIIYGIIEK